MRPLLDCRPQAHGTGVVPVGSRVHLFAADVAAVDRVGQQDDVARLAHRLDQRRVRLLARATSPSSPPILNVMLRCSSRKLTSTAMTFAGRG